MKKILLTLTIGIAGLHCVTAQNNSNTVVLDSQGNELHPYAKGTVTVNEILPESNSSNTVKLYIAKMVSFADAIKQNGLLNPPYGFEIVLNNHIADITDNTSTKPRDIFTASIQATLSPLCKTENVVAADYRIHSGFYLFMNNPSKLAGTPIIADIYACPRKTDSFHSYPIYATTDQELTIVNYTNKPLFLTVSQEDYIKTLIADLEKKIDDDTKGKAKYQQDVNNLTDSEQKKQQNEEFERAYNELLKYDKNAAEEFKKSIQEANKTLEASSEDLKVGEEAYSNSIDIHKSTIEQLKKELSGMSDAERKRQAYYALGASEYSNLLPESKKDLGEALVRINPNLIDFNSNKLQVVCIQWSFSDNKTKDKPRLFKPTDNPDFFIDSKTYQLYNDAQFWKSILQTLGK